MKTVYDQQLETAKNKVAEIFESDSVLGVKLNITRGHNEVRFGPPNQVGRMVGVPDGNRKYLVEPITVDTDAYLDLQFAASEGDSFRNFLNGAYEPTVSFVYQAIVTGMQAEIPTPVLEIKESGQVSQEGRSRTLGVQNAGLARMPVWLAQQVYR
jgi:hypothetical protein